VTFRYDPLGRRIEKSAATTTRYLYDQEDIVEELDGSNALRLRYTHGPGIDEPLARRDAATGVVAYYAADGLGSITDTTNSAGLSTPLHRYDSYGTVLAGSSSGGNAFTGREWDPETGLYYYRARYYAPDAGRFLSSDANVAVAGDMSYSYVADNPVGFIDPSGHLFQSLWWYIQYQFIPTGSQTLNDLGLLDAYQNTPAIRLATTRYRNRVVNELRKMADSKCGGCQGGSHEFVFDLTANKTFDPDFYDIRYSHEPDLWALGSSNLTGAGRCRLSIDCASGSYTYQCAVDFSLSDPFKQPYTWLNKSWTWESGHPFDMGAAWTDIMKGGGHL